MIDSFVIKTVLISPKSPTLRNVSNIFWAGKKKAKNIPRHDFHLQTVDKSRIKKYIHTMCLTDVVLFISDYYLIHHVQVLIALIDR